MDTKLVRRNKGLPDVPNPKSEKQGDTQVSTLRLIKPMPTLTQRVKDGPFCIAVILSQVVGLICISLVIGWIHQFGGFAWSSSADKQFFWHPFCMILGLIFCYGDAIIIYRAFSFLSKKTLKLMHASLHMCAIILSSIGLVAVLEFHKRKGFTDFYSLHSWIGIGTYAFFCLQYIGSFITFLFPGLPMNWRTRIMPFHVFFGIGLFAMAVATALMGLTEKLLWVEDYKTGTNSSKGIVGNVLGLCLIIFAFLIIFIATNRAYKWKP